MDLNPFPNDGIAYHFCSRSEFEVKFERPWGVQVEEGYIFISRPDHCVCEKTEAYEKNGVRYCVDCQWRK